MNQPKTPHEQLLKMSTQIVTAYASYNPLPAERLPEVIDTVYRTLAELDGGSAKPQPAKLRPAVPIRKSVTPDHIVCLEDGRKLKMLKRHLWTAYGLTPDQYREKWGLPADYPMVAPNYADQRSRFAKEIGLGRRPKAARRDGRTSRAS